MRRTLAATAALAAVTIGAAAAAPAHTGSAATPAGSAAAPKKITAAGVGKVRLGRTFRALRRDHLVGRLRHGCELGGPDTRAARLRAPLRGLVNFTLTNPRRTTDITVTRGATARGVGIGDRIADIKAAFPKAKVDHSTEDVFQFTLVRVPKSGGGRIQFTVPLSTKRIDSIAVPRIAPCE
jgi:hypothetical protein